MCGIAGVIGLKGPSEEFEDIVDVMLDAMSHRGPDERGVVRLEHGVIGHVRLSIIDLKGGKQPKKSSRSGSVLAYNGEVYNFKELRSSLPTETYEDNSDTDVVFNYLEKYGADSTSLFNGMYALAYWDNKQDSLLLAVDPLSIKPLYYVKTEKFFCFASELRALIKALRKLGSPLVLDHHHAKEFLRNGWSAAPNTLVEGVKKCIPGQRMVLRKAQLSFLPETQVEDSEEIANLRDEESVKRQFRKTFDESVKRQFVSSDVPVGLFLSGGIDSSLLLAKVKEFTSSINTFTIGFQGDSPEYEKVNEANVAKKVAQTFGSNHHEIILSDDDLRNLFETALQAQDEPIVDPAVLPLYALSKFAAEEVKVCLSGDGGDELFNGYLRHSHLRYQRAVASFPGFVTASLKSMAKALPKAKSDVRVLEILRKLRLGIDILTQREYLRGPFALEYEALLSTLPDESLKRYELGSDMEIFEHDVFGQLSGQMLPKTDRITMANSIEVRVPFLDNNLIAFSKSLSAEYKIRGGESKWLLRDYARSKLPPEITERKKHGFRVPISAWFKQKETRYMVESLMDDNRIPETVVSRQDISTLVNRHILGEGEESIRIWALLVLNHWLINNDLEI